MFCFGCFRDVPDLVGPNEDLCPECHGISAEDFVPSLAAAGPQKAKAADDELIHRFAEDFADFLAELDDFEDLDDAVDELDVEEPADFPTFRGRPRF
jgi:hypothetical protein